MARTVNQGMPRATNGRVAVFIIFLLLLYIILPRIGSFSDSLGLLRRAQFEQVVLAGLLIAITYIFAAGIYHALAGKKLTFRRTLLVQIASAFANRLLPAGLGGLTLNAAYLRKSGYSLAESLATVATNNILGAIGHILLLVVVVMIGGYDVLYRNWHVPNVEGSWVIAVGLTLLGVILLLAKNLRQYLYTLGSDVYRSVVGMRQQPWRLACGLSLSIALTIFHVLALHLCMRAVGGDISLLAVFVVFTIGIIAGTATPTPGGLGGVEAGLVGGLVAYGLNASEALAAVLLYRLIAYWLLLLPGFIAFLCIRKRYIAIRGL